MRKALQISNYSGTNPILAKILLTTSAVSIFISAAKYFQSREA